MSTPGDPSTNHSPAVPNASNAASEQSIQNYACVLCSQRKIKCDRLQPCSRCIKSRAECVYRAPDPPKRRKRKSPEGDDEMRSRLHEYERLLKQAGIDIKTAPPVFSESAPPASNSEQVMEELAQSKPTVPNLGHLFVYGSKTKYHETSLYDSVENEFQQHSDMFKAEDEPEEEPSSYLDPLIRTQNPANILFAPPSTDEELRRLQPSRDHARQMWFIFKERVDPLLKLWDNEHKQDRYMAVLDSLGTRVRPMEPWMFASCLMAVLALSDDECLVSFGEPKNNLFRRLKYATQQALLGAGLLCSSDTIVLQAYVLFLLSVAHEYDVGTYWIMTGIALRIALRGGLHRDQSSLGMDKWPWHAEMRRRIWWQIILIDLRASELTGIDSSFSFSNWDTKFPLNVNDNDLNMSIRELPPERTGATDMMFCLINYEMREFYREVRSTPSISQAVQNFQIIEHSPEEKDKVVDELERRIEQKYLRYCDPLVPLHHLCLITARAAIAISRLMIHYPRNHSTEGDDIPLARREMLFTTALKVIEYHNLVYENKSTRKFAWSMEIRFPWHALVFLLGELRLRTIDNTDHAWTLVEQFVGYNPTLWKETRKALHVACCSLAIKAWDSRIKALQKTRQALPAEPEFITQLRLRRDKVTTAVQENARYQSMMDLKPRDSAGVTGSLGDNIISAQNANWNGLDPALATASNGTFDFSPMNWAQWDDLILQNFDLPQDIQDMAGTFD